MSDTELLDMSEPVRRLEVFTGAGRRRSWSAQQKARIVSESHCGGETVCAVARRHGLTPQQLFAWRRHARQQAEESGLAFAPVVVASAREHDGLSGRLPRRAPPSTPSAIEILIGTALVRVPSGADVAILPAVLRAVKALS
jgi:transposase